MRSPNKPLVVIVGPTGVGKTEFAIRVAEAVGGEIVSADSRLFYRGMDIGTAKPSPAERARVPHHLIDVADPDQPWSLAVFQQQAAEKIAEIHSRNRLPLLVGGTGQYIKAVVEGWRPPTQPPDLRLRQELERWGAQIGRHELHQRLAVLDPDAAGFIDASNLRRTVRAIEVILSTGRRFSAQRQKTTSPYDLLMIGLTRPRAELYARIDARIDAMLRDGFVDEVRGLLDQGLSADLPTLSAIGYRQMIAYLHGEISLEEAVVQMKRLTRRYVRQQGAWFREEDETIHWFQPGDPALSAVVELIGGWLAKDRPDPVT